MTQNLTINLLHILNLTYYCLNTCFLNTKYLFDIWFDAAKLINAYLRLKMCVWGIDWNKIQIFKKIFFKNLYKTSKFFKGFFYLEIILTVLCQKQIIFFWQIKLKEFLLISCSENKAVAIIIDTSKFSRFFEYCNSKIVCYLFILHICCNSTFFLSFIFPFAFFLYWYLFIRKATT